MKFPSMAEQSMWCSGRICFIVSSGDMAAKLSLGWQFVVAVLGTISELSFT